MEQKEIQLNVNVYKTQECIVICGVPEDEDEHNCDHMGCGQEHVLYKFQKPNLLPI